jgi:HK97 gp10 family phage protein
MADEFTLHGTDIAVRRLREFPVKLQKRGLKAAVRKGANIVKQSAQAGAKQIDDPLTAESVAKNIAVQYATRESKRAGGVVYRVGVLGGAKQFANTRGNRRRSRAGQAYETAGDQGNPGGNTWYWRFIELGTSRIKARPFMQSALESNVERATDAIASELNVQIDKLTAIA